MKRLTALAAALLLVAACSSDRSSNAGTAGDTIDSTSVDTTTGDTTATTPATDGPTTVPDTTGSTEVCAPAGDLAPEASDDPLLMSSLFGADIRVGVHPCYERLVIELDGIGDFPGWSVEYVDDPVRLGESDEFAEIAGAATLSIRMGMWMTTMEGGGYQGEIDIFPTNVDHILELRQTYNHEGTCIWSIGLDAQYPFTVDVFTNPHRLVIDFQVPTGG